MNVRQIMSSPVFTLSPGIPASDALASMRDAGVLHAVVVAGTTVLGVVSTRDLTDPRGAAARKRRTVSDLMSPRLVPASLETTLRQAVLIMRTNHLRCLPVLDSGRVVGIVTRGDVLGALASDRVRARIQFGRKAIALARAARVASPTP